MLIDRYGCFGGAISQAGVESIAWYRRDGTVASDGIELERRANEIGGTHKDPQSLNGSLNADMFKVIADLRSRKH